MPVGCSALSPFAQQLAGTILLWQASRWSLHPLHLHYLVNEDVMERHFRTLGMEEMDPRVGCTSDRDRVRLAVQLLR